MQTGIPEFELGFSAPFFQDDNRYTMIPPSFILVNLMYGFRKS